MGFLKNAGQEWQKKKTPVEIRVPDFKDPVLAKAAPYGVYDLAANQGWLSVGNRSRYSGVRRWWQ